MEKQTQTAAVLNALLMFSNKLGIENFAQRLINLGYKLYGSQNTAKVLNLAGIECVDISTIVGEPLIDHKVVSLSREIHAGLLAETLDEIKEIKAKGIMKFSLACIDLYALEEAVNDEDATPASVRKKTDIGGPTAASSGAKGGVPTIIEESQRESLLQWLEAGKPEEEKYMQALEAHVNYFISRYRGLSAKFLDTNNDYLIVHGKKVSQLKYGENPHQKFAALYSTGSNDPLSLDKFKIVHGDNPSFVTMTDVDRAITTMNRVGAGIYTNYNISMAYVTIAVKHGNACGAAYSHEAKYSIQNAISGDCEAVMGAVVACNFYIDAENLKLLFRSYDPEGKKWGMLAAIVCEGIDDEALGILQEKNSGCFVFINPDFNSARGHLNTLPVSKIMRPVRGGTLVQDSPQFVPRLLGYVKEHGEDHGKSLVLAWAVCSTSNSNTITIVRDGKLLGNAVGQQKRVASAQLAVEKAWFANQFNGNEDFMNLKGAVAWGDSFFPYSDGVKVLSDSGIKTIFATSGSKRDEEVKKYCQENDVVFITFPDSEARAFSNH